MDNFVMAYSRKGRLKPISSLKPISFYRSPDVLKFACGPKSSMNKYSSEETHFSWFNQTE